MSHTTEPDVFRPAREEATHAVYFALIRVHGSRYRSYWAIKGWIEKQSPLFSLAYHVVWRTLLLEYVTYPPRFGLQYLVHGSSNSWVWVVLG